MNTRSFEELAEEGRRLIETAPGGQFDDALRWAMADLALEAVPPAEGRKKKSEAQKGVAKLAGAIGVSANSLAALRRTAMHWPPEARVDEVSYARHRELIGHPEKEQILRSPEPPPESDLPAGVRNDCNTILRLLRKPGRAEALEKMVSRNRASRIARSTAKEVKKGQNEEVLEAQRLKRQLEKELAAAKKAKTPDVLYLSAKDRVAAMPFTLLWLQEQATILPRYQREQVLKLLTQLDRTLQQTIKVVQEGERQPGRADVIDVQATEERSRPELPATWDSASA